MLLRDRVAVVYGASGAVGGAVARAYAREGAHVFLAARGRERLEAVAAEIAAAGGRAEVAPVDATDHDAVEAHLEAIAARAGPVKMMFNAVSLDDTQGQKLIDMPRERFIAPIVTGMKTWFSTGTANARHMAANGGGVIVGISANAAREAYDIMGGFGVSQAAIEHFLRHLAVENGPAGVRCVCVRSPGSPDAPGVREAFLLHAQQEGITLEEAERRAGERTPLRRLTPLAQIADVAVLLASDLAGSMTATVANATGGAQVD
ncbi:SDR family NAD(P)-dependent oxidoreductase [Devosia sp. A16]|uniref:SDR family NAD(P)-dependent oxidoreductase n=1 Tax=Devosia sp. A16 TaxID=1736675 RepID=UPI0006D78A67|nr:SDR family oxidoreductase [Devosia sp. A16]